MAHDEDGTLHKFAEELATQRDELRLQLHLLAAETRDEWDEVEEKWHHLQAKLGRVGESAKDSAADIGAAGEQLAEEIGEAYKRLKKAMRT